MGLVFLFGILTTPFWHDLNPDLSFFIFSLSIFDNRNFWEVQNFIRLNKDDCYKVFINKKIICRYAKRHMHVHLEDWKHLWKHHWKVWKHNLLIKSFGLEASNQVLYYWKHKMHITANRLYKWLHG